MSEREKMNIYIAPQMKIPDLTLLTLTRKFVSYCKKQLNLSGKVNIKLLRKPFVPTSAGAFIPETSMILVCMNNRAIADVLRTIAHEMTHMKQGEHGLLRLPVNTGEFKQKLEDQANVMSGRLVRWFGELNTEIYQDLSMD